MSHLKSEVIASIPKIVIFLILGITSVSRSITLLPAGITPSHENLPAPLIFHSLNGSPLAFIIAWFLSGILLLMSAFWGHKITVFHPKRAVIRLRLDDVALLINLLLIGLWGISYYLSWITSILHHLPSNDNISGRNYLPYAIIGFILWYSWFSRRAPKEAITGEAPIA